MSRGKSRMKQLDRPGLAVLLVAIGVLSLAGAFLWLHVTTPSDGARLERGVTHWPPDGAIVTPLEETPGGLRAGDVLVAVEGRSMESWAESLLDFRALGTNWQFGQTVTYTVLRDGDLLEVPVTLGRYPLGEILSRDWGAILSELISFFLAAFVFFKRPADRAARALFLATSGVLGSVPWSFGLQVSDLVGGLGFWLYLVPALTGYTLLWSAALHFALVFPKPHPILSQRRWIIPALYVAPYTVHAVYILVTRLRLESTFAWLGQTNGAANVIQLVYLGLAVAAVVSGHRAARDPVSRHQVRWIVFAFVVSGLFAIAFGMLPESLLGYPLLSWNVMGLVGLLLPMAIAMAILRYHLFDIDFIINRTLVYGALTASTLGLYVFIVGYVGNLFQARDRSIIAFLTTGLVAVLFQPLRGRLQHSVNRLMYGERDDPYTVLSRLGRRLEASLAPEAGLRTIVETVAQALKLPYVAITLKAGEGFEIAASFGLPVSDPFILTLTHQAETIGQLICAPRAPGEEFTEADQRLLRNVAQRASAVAHAVGLTADLQRSRERLVTTREEERRRIRRDLHDGLGPQLASLTLKLDAARNLLGHDPTEAEQLLVDLKAQVQAAIADIRRLVYELRPPALDELGLVGALREHAVSHSTADGPRISVEALESLPPLPAAVEVAAYRIALEALTNVARHAQAQECVIRLALDDALQLEITDDGIGLPKGYQAGVGLTSMRERAAELGGACVIEARPEGGTRVLARLPLPLVEE